LVGSRSEVQKAAQEVGDASGVGIAMDKIRNRGYDEKGRCES
jgi:hypothetical protein